MVHDNWKGKKVVATFNEYVQLLKYSKTKRNFLKIHNRSKDGFLKVAFSKKDIIDDIYVLVAPGGFWEMTNVIPKNEILVSGEESDCDVIVYTSEY